MMNMNPLMKLCKKGALNNVAIPLLQYAPTTNNQRVAGFEVAPGDEQPKVFTTDNLLSRTEIDDLIEAAYRQIFFHAFAWDREVALESQLRNGQITVRDFIRGLLLSKTFIDSFYNKNSNYRFVEHCVEKVLGRRVYSEREKIAWSAVVMTKGVKGFVDELLNSDEYISAFGENTVPYQRRRVLPGRANGELPFNIKSPRYDAYYRGKLGFPQFVWQATVRSYKPQDQKARAGSPAQFLDMARSISPRGAAPQQLSALNVDFLNAVPYRK
ncbi:phycobilisome rod-core linker polypeptide [Leptolyngbya sp. AN02str]|uniref:phycobilisome rod-core linker polypeptide n=1 Tax=Leptolyngbya sp. AN02str TaxID=3423363 RepID=UPI003D315F7D